MAPESLALWILHTYAFHLRDITTYLGVESPEKRCGKTTLLTVLSELVHRPVVAANISPSAFFRVIQETRPTLLIDEADTFLQGNDELRGILNSGYTRKTAFVVRVSSSTPPPLRPPEQSDGASTTHVTHGIHVTQNSLLRRFSTWCPKVMACTGKLPDTLADRCILVRMQRKIPSEHCDRLRNLQPSNLKAQCARFVQDHAQAIADARPDMPSELNDHAADIWEPLLVLADLAGGGWPKLARQAAKALSAGAQETNPGSSLLLDLMIAFVDLGAPRAFSRTLVIRLHQMAANRP